MGCGSSLTGQRSSTVSKDQGQGRKDSSPVSIRGVDPLVTGNYGNQRCPGRCLLPWRRSRDVDDEGHVIKTCPTWKEMLEEAGNAELWDGRPRRLRSGWKGYIRAAEQAVRAPRRALPEVVVSKVLEGDLSDIDRLKSPSSKVNVFISSTFTDTKAERNQLMKDVFPFMRDVCRVLGLDWGSVDMRWGVKEETAREHGTTSVCLQQVNRCCSESCGPAFLTILGNKYGFRPLPAEISQSEFDKLIQSLRSQSQPINDLTDFYLLDTNNVPPVYVLKPRDEAISKDDWWIISQELQRKFQLAARDLPPGEREKFFVSVTEQEIYEGCFKNEKRNSQVVYVNRELQDITHKHHRNGRLVDMADGLIDEGARTLMNDLKLKKLPNSLSGSPKSVLNLTYSDKRRDCFAQVRRTCDEICKVLCDKILASYRSHLHVLRDRVYDEVIRHSQFALQKSQVFRGHDALLDKITSRIMAERSTEKTITLLYGTSGSGKTCALAVLAKKLKMFLMPDACLVLRFIGTTSDSGSVLDLLKSICEQITRVYDQPLTEVPEDYEALVSYFRHCLSFSTPSQPLVVILDSLEQLLDDHCGHSLKWLAVQCPLPAHTHLLLSTNPGEALHMLQVHLPKESVFELPFLQKDCALEVIKALLEVKQRTLTDQQMDLLVTAFEWNPFPLYLKALADSVVRWRSYEDITSDWIAAGVSGMTSLMLERLERRYGKILIHHALAYISASKSGLSQTELEDVLSCDDEVLDEVFEFWLPPSRRIPPLLWVRIRADVSDVLVEKGSDGTRVYTWYHKQVREMVMARYLDKSSPPFREGAHRALAEYYDGRWVEGKVWTPRATSRTVKDLRPRLENRMVTPQPLVLCGGHYQKQRQLNRRKLRELMYHLMKCGDLQRFEEVCCTPEFVEAKFEVGQGYDCAADFKMAAQMESTPLIKAMAKVVSSGLQHLLVEPGAIYQMVGQLSAGNPARALLAISDHNAYPLSYIRERSEGPEVDDPCELTLRGHTAAVRCCQYSPDGAYIASTGEDGSLRIWDAQTGAEHVTIMGLPGPVYSKTADNTQVGDRPCVWAETGTKVIKWDKVITGPAVITGSEDGQLQAWTSTGAQVHTTPAAHTPAHSGPVTALSVSPDGQRLASCSKDGSLRVWALDIFTHVTTIDPRQGDIRGCEFSPNGKRLSLIFGVAPERRKETGASSGLNVYSTSDWSLKSSRLGADNRKLCCLSYSPDGATIATGSDLNVVELWEEKKQEAEVLPKKHHAYVRCVRFTDGGAGLVSCGDDFMVMVWDVRHRRHLATVAGHLHRVTSVSVLPKGQHRLVTASRDTTLKVWDYDVIRAGRVPEADGIPFVVLQTSHDRKFVLAVQGVNSFGRVYATGRVCRGERVAKTPRQRYSVVGGCWSVMGDRIVLLNAGHSGNSPVDAYKRAGVQVVPFTMCEDTDDKIGIDLDVKYPSCIAVNKDFIAVGTHTKAVVMFSVGDLSHARTLHWGREENDQDAEVDPSPEDQITCVALHPSRPHLAAVRGNQLNIWALRSVKGSKLKVKITSTNGHPIHACTYTPSGSHLIYTAMAIVVLLSATSRCYRQLQVISSHVDLVHSLAVCPLSRHLATASLDGTLRVWGLRGAGGREGALRAVYYDSTARRLAFVDSYTLLVGGGTGPIRKLVIEDNSEGQLSQKSKSDVSSRDFVKM